ncbi:MAG: ABC transporter substrate binding protein [bacterium]|nr:ABC transporter substrate binding protein [bacterium]
MDKKYIIIGAVLILIAAAAAVGFLGQKGGEKTTNTSGVPSVKYAGKKILFVNSYHEGYEWSDGVAKGIVGVLKDTGVELKTHWMDTKRNDSDQFGKEAGLLAKSVIEEFKPDVVIVCDDPAFKYLVKPYYKDAKLPFVFCGINWDTSIYGTPYKNATGMVEISLTPQLISMLKEHSKGTRVGFIAGNTSTDKKNAEYQSKMFNINFTKIYHVNTFNEWKAAFLNLQNETDLAILENNAGIVGWDSEAAEAFVLENIKIPLGTFQSFMMKYVLIGLIKIPEEQGEWSAQTALKILDGASPENIPEATNKKSDLMLNLKIAKKLNVSFTPVLIRTAKTIIKDE